MMLSGVALFSLQYSRRPGDKEEAYDSSRVASRLPDNAGHDCD